MTPAADPDLLAALRAAPASAALASALGDALRARSRGPGSVAWPPGPIAAPADAIAAAPAEAAAALAEPGAPGASPALGALLALWAEAIAPEGDAREAARVLCWAAAHTPIAAFSHLAAEHPAAAALWPAIGEIAAGPRGGDGASSRAEALAAAAGLVASDAAAARAARGAAAASCADPLVRGLLSGSGAAHLTGELASAPRGPVGTVLLGACGWLLLAAAAGAVGRFALDLRRPAELAMTPAGLLLRWRTELRGRVIRDREVVVPLGALAGVTREIRYSRAALYAGIAALALGSYAGMALFVDGFRVPGTSPALLGMGLLLLGLGVVIDYGLTVLPSAVRGRSRVIVTRLRGGALCVSGVDPAAADAMLATVAQRLERR
ncbi:MAG: hypothetical protein IT376_14335 [Polyangiaceae bacterium]|nr:hypothetical protein [Polyangiaceae bacterium]